MQSKQNLGNLTFGFDIGIASVGWAVLRETDDSPFMQMGVRAFDAAEDSDGKPNNQTRRGARVSRNRFQIRAWRLKQLRQLFVEVGLLREQETNCLFSKTHPSGHSISNPWELRAKALNEKLTNKEWAQVIYTLVKHRGFKFFSKKEDPREAALLDAKEGNSPKTEAGEQAELGPSAASKTEKDKEREGVKDGLNHVAAMRKEYPQFRTVGEMAHCLSMAEKDSNNIYQDANGNPLKNTDCEEFNTSIRNKDKSYKHAFYRDDLVEELNLLFDVQAEKGNLFANILLKDGFGIFENDQVQVSSEARNVARTFRAHVFALLEMQHPPIYADQMDALIGDCELEEGEKRASKNAFSNERSTWLQMLNNLRIYRNGKEVRLSEAERAVLLSLPYTQSKLTFAQARDALRVNVGFPAQWREASFNKVSYRSNRKSVNKWVNIIKANGEVISLDKYIADKNKKKVANKVLKEQSEKGQLSFAQLREIYNVNEYDVFEYVSKREEIVVKNLEQEYLIDITKLASGVQFIKILEDKAKTAKKFDINNVLKSTSVTGATTLADLRQALDVRETYAGHWQFELSEKFSRTIELSNEASELIPIEYEDAQKNEDSTFIELKGWHALKRVLAEKHNHFWQSLQIAWQEPLSAEGRAKAGLIDEIAEILTKMQTDKEVENALQSLSLSQDVIASLQAVDFKGYKNLSLKALRKILPYLEQGRVYSEACNEAEYKKAETLERKKFLLPLKTDLYERFRHGKKTKHTEKRFKEVNNPVVARAFSQARLVLNALIAEYGSPAYVHIELARDMAKSKKERDKIESKQKESRVKRDNRRKDFFELHGYEPLGELDLKLQLLDEQMQQCAYTLTELRRDQVISDSNYAQIDHIWPRSKTWDNSMGNKVLVHAHANQNKGDRIPYDYIRNDVAFGVSPEARETHWRKVEKHIMTCHGMSDKKQQRVIAKTLDADEFMARNLVDTRYATRLFSNMVRDQLLFAGQSKSEKDIDDIDAAENGKTRWEKYQKTRVRTPQGGVVAFLRGKWLGDKIKNREASDKHHAIDALIAAACTPELIHRVNTWFANEENQPKRFEKRADGTYADKGTGEIVSKNQARERGLYLPAPWDDKENNSGTTFRKLFAEQYEQVFVSRLVRRKQNVKLHDANPMAWKQQKKLLRVRLYELTLEQLDTKKLPEIFVVRNGPLIEALRNQLHQFNGDASKAFLEPFEFRQQKIRSIKLPPLITKGKANKKSDVNVKQPFNPPAAHKTESLVDLKLEQLTKEKLGEQYFRRNDKLINALIVQLEKYNNKADKAFAAPFYPFGTDKPFIRSIRLPKNIESGLFVRHGISGLGESLRTEVYLSEGKYLFKPIYKVADKHIFGTPQEFKKDDLLFSVTQNDLLKVVFKDGTHLIGYFVCYLGDRRMKIRNHDQPNKKEAHRFSVSSFKTLEKYQVDVLGGYRLVSFGSNRGLA